MNYKKTKHSQEDLMEIFEVSSEWVRLRRKEYFQGEIDEEEDTLKMWFKIRSEPTELVNTKEFIDWQIDISNNKLSKLYRRLKMYSTRKAFKYKHDISIIREIPVSSVMDSPSYEQYGKVKYICPLHQEKTASFTWYKDTNSWYCFGCKRGGSVIDLVMKQENCDAKEAIEKLSFYL